MWPEAGLYKALLRVLKGRSVRKAEDRLSEERLSRTQEMSDRGGIAELSLGAERMTILLQ